MPSGSFPEEFQYILARRKETDIIKLSSLIRVVIESPVTSKHLFKVNNRDTNYAH